MDDLASPRFGSYFATSNTYAQNFKNKFSDVNTQIYQAHHAIPRELEYNFKMITNSDINSLENLRGMPNQALRTEITNLWKSWLAPYKQSGTNPTMSFLMEKANYIGNNYGTKFIPTVR